MCGELGEKDSRGQQGQSQGPGASSKPQATQIKGARMKFTGQRGSKRNMSGFVFVKDRGPWSWAVFLATVS